MKSNVSAKLRRIKRGSQKKRYASQKKRRNGDWQKYERKKKREESCWKSRSCWKSKQQGVQQKRHVPKLKQSESWNSSVFVQRRSASVTNVSKRKPDCKQRQQESVLNAKQKKGS